MLSVINSISVGNAAWQLALAADGRLYVLHHDGFITAIDTDAWEVADTFPIPGMLHVMDFVIHPDADRAYLSPFDSPILVLDLHSGAILDEIAIPNEFAYLAMHPDGDKLYAATALADGSSHQFVVIDTGLNVVSGSIDFGAQAGMQAISPDGSRLYVSKYPTHEVAVLDTATNEILPSLDVGGQPGYLTVGLDGSRVFVTTTTVTVTPPTLDAIVTVATATGAVEHVTALPGAHLPIASVAAHPNGTEVYISSLGPNAIDGQLRVLDIGAGIITESVDITAAAGMTIHPGGNAFVTDAFNDQILLLGRSFAVPSSRIPELVGKLVGGVASDGGGWIIVGNKIYKIPPRPLAVLAIARAAAAHLGKPIENRKITDQLRKML